MRPSLVWPISAAGAEEEEAGGYAYLNLFLTACATKRVWIPRRVWVPWWVLVPWRVWAPWKVWTPNSSNATGSESGAHLKPDLRWVPDSEALFGKEQHRQLYSKLVRLLKSGESQRLFILRRPQHQLRGYGSLLPWLQNRCPGSFRPRSCCRYP